jgi:MFS family permease
LLLPFQGWTALDLAGTVHQEAGGDARNVMPLTHTFRALAHRNFRLFFLGQGVSLIGTWMQQVAMSWVVYELTRSGDQGGEGTSAYWLGVVGFASQVPSFFLAPVAGVLVDRWNRHRLIILTQTLAMLQAFVLAALTYYGLVTVGWIVALSVVLGLVNAFDMPARQAFLTEMIDTRDDLANAIALNSSMFNGARLVGPALAAALLALVGAAVCFFLNGVSYIAVIVALFAMRVRPRAAPPVKKHLYQGLREGFAYVFGFAPIRAILLLVGLVSMAAMSYSVLLPLVAGKTLRGGPGMFGVLTTAAGFGALTGAVYLASRKTVLGLGRWILAAPAIMGAGLIVFSFAAEPALAVVSLAVIGFAMMVHMAASNTVVQTIVEDDKRGRVMSLYTMAFMGMAPLGSLLAGFLADRFGPAAALRAGGVACLLGSLAFALQFRRVRALVRPIYVSMGILPEMPSGVYPAVAPPSPLPEPKEGGEPAGAAAPQQMRQR